MMKRGKKPDSAKRAKMMGKNNPMSKKRRAKVAKAATKVFGSY